LLLIVRFALYAEWDVLPGQRLKRGFRYDMLTRFKDVAGKSTEKKAKRLLFCSSILKRNRHHESNRSLAAAFVQFRD
jgi:hypothetical protein